MKETHSSNLRRRLFEIIEIAKEGDKISSIYDVSMMILIIVSLIPLAFKETNTVFQIIEIIATVAFLFDYFARWITADFRQKKDFSSFLIYPITPMAIIDLLAILPSFHFLSSGFRVLKVFRLVRSIRVFRIFKFFRYSRSFAIIANVVKKQKEALTAVCILAVAYILICALIIFNVEPDTFNTFFDAVYWATVSLTTVGYGDIYAVSKAGKLITMLSAVVGIAIVALPAGIITAGYMNEISGQDEE